MFHCKLLSFRGNPLPCETLLLSGNKYMLQPTIKCLELFKSNSLKKHALKTVLQDPFRKKDPMFCEKEASVTKIIITDIISFFLARFLELQNYLRGINLGSSNCGSCLGIHNSP